jgi:hypothetical protein
VTWDVAGGIALLALLLVAVGLLWRRRSMTGAALAGLLILLALPTHAIPLANWLYAERWLYVPSILVAALVGVALAQARWKGAVAGVALAIILLPATWFYGSAFTDDLTMMREVVLRQPDNFQGRCGLASALCHRGHYAAAVHAAQEVIDRFETTGDDRFPPPADPYLILTVSYLKLEDGRRALAALDEYEHRLRSGPTPSLNRLRKRVDALVERERPHGPTTSAATAPDGFDPR